MKFDHCHRYLSRVFVFFLVYMKSVIKADYTATLSGCPTGFTRVNNGCYSFVSASTNWSVARSTCNALITNSTTVTHLLALESEPETIAIAFWLKGTPLAYNYWTDGYISYTAATYITVAQNLTYWEWSSTEASYYDYLQYSGVQAKNGYAVYLYWNGTGDEYRSTTVSTQLNYICEASIKCLDSDNVCMNNGTCYVNSGRVLCTCLSGFTGSLCEVETDNCDSVPCLHGATCTNQVNNYTCSCTPYYSGRNCDSPTNYGLEGLRQAVLWICVTIVVTAISLLCLMDLPWNGIIKFLATKRKERIVKAQMAKEEEVQTDDNVVQKATYTRAQLLNSEEEILRKLQITLRGKSATDFAIRNRSAL